MFEYRHSPCFGKDLQVYTNILCIDVSTSQLNFTFVVKIFIHTYLYICVFNGRILQKRTTNI